MSIRIGIGLGLIPTAARPAATTAPVNVVKPYFEGPLTQGQSAAVNPGSWTGLPSPNFTYVIKRGATTVSTDPDYVWTAADVAAGAGAMTVEVTATNDIGPTTATSDPVTIAATLHLSGSPPEAAVGAPYAFTPARTGGHAPYAFVLTGTLPTGLTFDTTTGAISGAPVATGSADLLIDVTDGDGLTASVGPFSLVVATGAYTEGDGLTATPIAYRGASNVSGNQDGTGVSVGSEVQARVANPSDVHNEGASGASNVETLAKYNAASAALKSSDQVLQLFGLNDASGNPRDRMANVKEFIAAFDSNDVGQWALMSSLNVTGQYGASWASRRQIDLMIRDAYGPKAMSLGTIQLDPVLFPRADALNDGDASHGLVPRQYLYNSSHMNAAGYIRQADAVWWPITRAFSGVLPCLVYPEVLATAPTANSEGGLVADVGVLGDLAGCTVDLLSHQGLFAVAIQATGVGTSLIRVTRNAGGAIAAAYSDIQVRITKGTVRDVYTLRLGIAALDDDCHEVAYESLGQNNAGNTAGAHYAMFEPSSGLDPAYTTNTKYSAFIKFRPLEGAMGLGYGLSDGGGSGLFTLGVNTNGSLTSRARNGTTTTSVYTHANTATIRADSTDWELCCFVSVDTTTGVAFFRYERISHSAPGAVGVVEPANSGAMPLNSPLGLARVTQRCVSTGGTGVPMVHGCQWEAADFMDFREEANRALFRDATTLALKNNYERASFDRVMAVAGAGAGGYVTPYISIRGNAAERVLGDPNRGNGTTTTIDPGDTGRLSAAFSGCTITTVS